HAAHCAAPSRWWCAERSRDDGCRFRVAGIPIWSEIPGRGPVRSVLVRLPPVGGGTSCAARLIKPLHFPEPASGDEEWPASSAPYGLAAVGGLTRQPIDGRCSEQRIIHTVEPPCALGRRGAL